MTTNLFKRKYPEKFKVFMDTEFTGLHQNTTLISIGCVAETGHTFYAELTDYDESQIDNWIKENVIGNLHFRSQGEFLKGGFHTRMKGNLKDVERALEFWLFCRSTLKDSVQIWSDCYAYDWMLFNQLFGGAMEKPHMVHYIPMDLSTLFYSKGIDPDISRSKFSKLSMTKLLQHNALADAIAIMGCYYRLMKPRNKREINKILENFQGV